MPKRYLAHMPAASPYRPEFEAALRLLSQISEEMASEGRSRPVLVGGGAVEYYSASMMMTGDIDLCAPAQSALEAIMQTHGFIRPRGAGKLTRGWIHPDLKLGFEIVASIPMDGTVDSDHILLIEEFSDSGSFAIISVEDLIADRMGQFASGSAPEMRGQAQQLFSLHPGCDLAYLEKRIRMETMGDFGVDDLNNG
jgi:hypothetical protein